MRNMHWSEREEMAVMLLELTHICLGPRKARYASTGVMGGSITYGYDCCALASYCTYNEIVRWQWKMFDEVHIPLVEPDSFERIAACFAHATLYAIRKRRNDLWPMKE